MNFEAVDDWICSLKMRWKFNNFTILVHAPVEERDELVKDFCYDKLNQIYQRTPAHDVKIVVGNFNAKTGREDFMPWYRNWACMKHQMKMELEQLILKLIKIIIIIIIIIC